MSVANLSRTIPEPGGLGTLVSNGIVADVHQLRHFLESAGL
jgi:hypothetical protein